MRGAKDNFAQQSKRDLVLNSVVEDNCHKAEVITIVPEVSKP